MHDIVIVDFGSQFTPLIQKRLSQLGVSSEMFTLDSFDSKKLKHVKGLVLSGGPFSVNDGRTDKVIDDCISLRLPILGICYGMQAICKHFDGVVSSGKTREFGGTVIEIPDPQNVRLFHDLGLSGNKLKVWMSHCDTVEKIPQGFRKTAVSEGGCVAAMDCVEQQIYCVQFHPEVTHTQHGKDILYNFAVNIAGCKNDWRTENEVSYIVNHVKKSIGSGKAIIGVSGGVDSTVAAKIVHDAIGKRLQCMLVDNGLLRLGEVEVVRSMFSNVLNIELHICDASEKFIANLQGVTDPEMKRKIIGRTFIEVFEENISSDVQYLIQGTLHSDVIESGSGTGHTIKSHHNVGGLPETMRLKVVEPLRELFKNEVRAIGERIGVPSKILNRHPFPGPGLAIRIIGEVTRKKLDILRQADAVFIRELTNADLYDATWQAFVVLMPARTVGVMGDGRTYEHVCAIRAVDSEDGMTACPSRFSLEFLSDVATKIVSEVPGISRVVYDITSKPPASIEWE